MVARRNRCIQTPHPLDSLFRVGTRNLGTNCSCLFELCTILWTLYSSHAGVVPA